MTALFALDALVNVFITLYFVVVVFSISNCEAHRDARTVFGVAGALCVLIGTVVFILGIDGNVGEAAIYTRLNSIISAAIAFYALRLMLRIRAKDWCNRGG